MGIVTKDDVGNFNDGPTDITELLMCHLNPLEFRGPIWTFVTGEEVGLNDRFLLTSLVFEIILSGGYQSFLFYDFAETDSIRRKLILEGDTEE